MRNFLLFFFLCCIQPLFAQELNIDHGSTYAVVVGISDYQDEAIPDLRFADKDALAFASFLQSQAGGSLNEDHLKVLINKQATGAQFAMALDWLIEVTREGDKALIYFSGHGDVEKKRITQPGYLLCWDAPPRVYTAGGAYNVRDLKEIVSTISVHNKSKVVLITDACRAGKLSGSGVGGAQATAASLQEQYANEIKILSCQPDEYSIEGEQWGSGRGAFSYHLLDGLYGMADSNSDLNIDLKEIGRYLEDKVSEEVAPHNQNPMTFGSKTEKLTDVFPEILAQLKEGKRGQMQIFTATESKGIEDDVLAAVDATIVEIYVAFQKSLQEKQFLEPIGTCSDAYYEKLIREPALERLHSSIRRNYAAALQDDAQQVMNTMLNSGLTEQVLKDAKAEDIYGNYPTYLDRAAELLGKDHYMYNTLQARVHFFEGMILKKRKDKRLAFHKALDWKAEMPHSMVYLIRNFEAEQADSADYYFYKAAEMIPSWVEPYIALSEFYHRRLKQIKRAQEILHLAGQVDSTSVLVWRYKSTLYWAQRNYKACEKALLKTIEGTPQEICFPCIYLNLGLVYTSLYRYKEAEQAYKKVIQLDSSFVMVYSFLGLLYERAHRYKEAEQAFQKNIQLDSISIFSYNHLGDFYRRAHRYKEAEQTIQKAIQLDSTGLYNNSILGFIYNDTQRFREAEQIIQKVLQLDSTFVYGYNILGIVYRNTHRYKEAEKTFKKAIRLDSMNVDAWSYYVNLGDLYQFVQRWKESKLMIQKAIKIGPKLPGIYARLGNAFTHIPNSFENASPTLEKALEMDPDLWVTYIYLAQLALKNNQLDKAWEYLEQGLEKRLYRGVFMETPVELLLRASDFDRMRMEAKWEELMKKYFPEQVKK